MAKMFDKLPGGKKKPVPLDKLDDRPLATKPVAGGFKSKRPEVNLVAVIPGSWYGEGATLTLLECRFHPNPPIPEAEVAVRIKATTDDLPHPPKVVGWGPDRVVAEKQDVERKRGVKGAAHVGADGGLADASVDAEVNRDSVQHDTQHGCYSARPHNSASEGYGGVDFVLSQVPGSKQGLPPCARLALLYKYDGAVELQAELKIHDTLRRYTFGQGEQQRVVWKRGDERAKPKLPCTSCVAKGKSESCRDFSHSDEQFWFSLLYTVDLDDPEFLPLPPTTDVRGFCSPSCKGSFSEVVQEV